MVPVMNAAAPVDWEVVRETKTVHVGATDGLPPSSEYPVGTVIVSPDGERFRLDLVPTRTTWTPVEAHVPAAIDYTKLSARELVVAIQQGDEEAGVELDRRLSGVAAAKADLEVSIPPADYQYATVAGVEYRWRSGMASWETVPQPPAPPPLPAGPPPLPSETA